MASGRLRVAVASAATKMDVRARHEFIERAHRVDCSRDVDGVLRDDENKQLFTNGEVFDEHDVFGNVRLNGGSR